jgi:hypothetical protein
MVSETEGSNTASPKKRCSRRLHLRRRLCVLGVGVRVERGRSEKSG